MEAVERAEHTYMDNLEYAAGLCAKVLKLTLTITRMEQV